MGMKTGIFVLLLLCGLIAAHAEHKDAARPGECWGASGRSDDSAVWQLTTMGDESFQKEICKT